MDHSIVDTAMTSRKRKREEYKKIILLAAACVVHMVIGVVTWYHNNYFVKEPTRNWELERHSFLNHLYRGTNKDCIEQLRLSKNAFFNLCRILQEKGGLVRTRNVPTTEAISMFLHILAHNLKYRVVQFSYCRSKETISRQFNDILRAVMKVSKNYLNFQPCTLEGAEANKWRWFERCIGALDETHIPVTVSPYERPRYRNRKGDVSTNVLAACGPDLRFIYVLPGWEGSAGDSRVLRDALRRQNKLEIPTGKYFLVDAGYTNGPGFLAPYRGTRYHLNEWIGNTPQSYKELFNLHHPSARNAIERDQRNLGNKGDGGWKRSALNAVATVLSTSFNVNVTSDNIKNRIKLWRSWYGIVSDILGQSGFDWDGTKHMITVENENAWNEYCTSHKSAKPFRYKVLQNWDDIVDLCAKDRATGHGAETAMDADEAMSRETNEVEFMGLGATAIDLEEPSSNTKGKRQGSTSSGTHPHKRKMGEKEGIAASLDKMTNSFNRMVEKMDGKVDDEDIQEVLCEAALIPDLNRQQWAKAIKWLADDPKQLAIVKALPIHQKTDYVLTHLGE
ncbi:putative nuclease HARBI1 [Glycine max]|nr:putative nuclease HARBI1 [Glycine max]